MGRGRGKGGGGLGMEWGAGDCGRATQGSTRKVEILVLGGGGARYQSPQKNKPADRPVTTGVGTRPGSEGDIGVLESAEATGELTASEKLRGTGDSQ